MCFFLRWPIVQRYVLLHMIKQLSLLRLGVIKQRKVNTEVFSLTENKFSCDKKGNFEVNMFICIFYICSCVEINPSFDFVTY